MMRGHLLRTPSKRSESCVSSTSLLILRLVTQESDRILLMKALVFSVVALLCAAGCTVNSTAAPTPTGPSTFSVSGTITLRSVSGWRTDYGVCYGLGGYSDIRQGAQVKVTDAAGKVVGLGDLGAGQQVGSLLEGCAFTFGVVGVPADGDIYGVEVTNRGIVQFKKADAGSLSLTLG